MSIYKTQSGSWSVRYRDEQDEWYMEISTNEFGCLSRY